MQDSREQPPKAGEKRKAKAGQGKTIRTPEMLDARATFLAVQERLVDYEQAIRDAQPKRDGAVLLDLHYCGKSCDFCPHPRWVIWVGGNARQYRWHAAIIENPLSKMRSKAYSPVIKKLVADALRLVEIRSALARRMADAEWYARLIRYRLPVLESDFSNADAKARGLHSSD